VLTGEEAMENLRKSASAATAAEDRLIEVLKIEGLLK
jgi:hypothetical protein